MKNVLVDVESDGFLETLTKLHCLVIRDVDSDTVWSCADQPGYTPIEAGVNLLREAETIYGHNIIAFDAPAIEKVTGYKIPFEKLRDTFTIAGMRWAHAKEMDHDQARKGAFPSHLAGNHGLEAWGHRLGIHKGAFAKSDPRTTKVEQAAAKTAMFKVWSKEMQTYCEQDTAVTKSLLLHIRKHGASAESIETEHQLARYLAAQERNGWPFNLEKAVVLQGKLAARREVLSTELKRVFGSWYVPERYKGEIVLTLPKKDIVKRGVTAACPYVKLKLIEFNPGSRQHIANRLTKLYGWTPTEFTPSGQPEINDKTIAGLDQTLPGVNLLNEYLLVEKRLGQLAEGKEAWLGHATKDRADGGKLTGLHHIHGKIWQSGTITHRSSHSTPNLGQVPKVGKPYGAECRELFEVPEGWVQVGADASGLEARNLAHYMSRYDGGAYGKLMLEGDVHTENQKALGMPEGKVARDRAKTWFYAFMYGAGDQKLGSILEPSAPPNKQTTIGKAKKAQFFKATPAIELLIGAVKAKAQQGYLTLIDGRRTYVRSDHAALNTLLQSAGAIICKRWIVNFARRLEAEFGPQGWNGKWAALGWIHDEVQLAVRPEIAERVKEILVEEIRKLTQHYGWRVPLDGEAKSGRNWKDTH